MVKFFKKTGIIILGLLSITGIVFLITIGLKRKGDFSSYKDKLKKKLNEIDEEESGKLKEIELKADLKRKSIEKTSDIQHKRKRLQKLADMVNKNEFTNLSKKSTNSEQAEFSKKAGNSKES